jgi:hypothetical protein
MTSYSFNSDRTTSVKHLIWPTFLLILAFSACSNRQEPITFTNAIGTTPTPAPTLAPGQKPEYSVRVDDSVDGLTVRVTFSGVLPGPEEVDKILRTEFEKVIKKTPSVDATVSAGSSERYLTENEFSGDLYYKAATKSILTADEFYDVKMSTEMSDGYMLVTEDHTGSPEGNFLLMTLVFPQIPPQNLAYDALIREIDKARPRGVNILAYVKAGDKDKRTFWYQVIDPDGNPIYADYGPMTNQISTGMKVLKTYPPEKRN